MMSPNVRKVCFGGRCISVESDSSKGQKLIEFLFKDTPINGDVEPHVLFSLSTNGSKGNLNCYKDGKLVNESTSLGAAGRYLMDRVLYHLTDKCSNGLVFHAAALSNGKYSFILPGQSGAGKSTLTAWLVKNGFNYITDELVFVGNNSTEFEGFVRPLNIKSPALPVIQEFVDLSDAEIKVYVSNISTLVPHRMLNKSFSKNSGELKAIIFLKFQKNAKLSLQPLTPAQTGMKLVSLLVNARNLSGHGFPEIGRISKLIQGYQLRYGCFNEIKETIGKCLADD